MKALVLAEKLSVGRELARILGCHPLRSKQIVLPSLFFRWNYKPFRLEFLEVCSKCRDN